jgi:aminoglycoside phosphotransferase (APT) family kinase protein
VATEPFSAGLLATTRAVRTKPVNQGRLPFSMPKDLLGGRHEIVSLLGAGGIGEVFLAEDTRLERRVAVKRLPASLEADLVARERLRREALAGAALDHPFICKVHEIGDADGRMFIVMEFVDGETLHAAARRALLPLRQVIDLAHELAQALDAAHRRNIIFRQVAGFSKSMLLRDYRFRSISERAVAPRWRHSGDAPATRQSRAKH